MLRTWCCGVTVHGTQFSLVPHADKMRHHGRLLADLKTSQLIFQRPIRLGDALILAHEFEPAMGEEHFQVAGRVCRIGEMVPEQRAVAAADMAHAFENVGKGDAPHRVDAIFDGHQ
jgi:hypothetical protein